MSSAARASGPWSYGHGGSCRRAHGTEVNFEGLAIGRNTDWGGPSGPPLSSDRLLVARPSLHLLFQLFLQALEIEGGAFLHRRELEEGLSVLRHLLLHEDEPPELVDEPVVVRQRPGDARPLERIEP